MKERKKQKTYFQEFVLIQVLNCDHRCGSIVGHTEGYV